MARGNVRIKSGLEAIYLNLTRFSISIRFWEVAGAFGIYIEKQTTQIEYRAFPRGLRLDVRDFDLLVIHVGLSERIINIARLGV